MTTPVDFHRLAVGEIRHERRYYTRISVALAARFMADVDDAVARIAANPQLGSPHHHGTRICRLRRFPFYLVYLEDSVNLFVIAVANNHRRPGYWRRRTS